MPRYEYQCSECRHAWEVTEHIEEHTRDHVVRCPQCGSEHVERILGSFFAKTGRKT